MSTTIQSIITNIIQYDRDYHSDQYDRQTATPEQVAQEIFRDVLAQIEQLEGTSMLRSYGALISSITANAPPALALAIITDATRRVSDAEGG